jgi:hypothetical protein
MRWTVEGILDKKYHNIFYSCDRKHHMFGTGFLVNKRISTWLQTLKPKHPEYVRYVLEDCSSSTASFVYINQQKKKMMMKRIIFMKVWIRFMRNAKRRCTNNH